MPTAEDFLEAFRAEIRQAKEAGRAYIDINSGELHRIVGGHPGTDHRMPVCCAVMLNEQRAGDVILAQPPKRKGASLTIRYQLPR